MSTTPTTASKWHDSYNPLPSRLVRAKVWPSDDRSVTFAVRNDDVVDARKYFGSEGYGLKLRTSKLCTGDKRLVKLGEYPKDLCGKEYSNKNKALPPALKASTYWCQATDMNPNYERSQKRDTHIEPDSSCFFTVIEHTLSVGDITLFTVGKDRHEHKCECLKKHLLPLTAEQKLFFVKGVIMCGSVEEFHKNVLVEMALNCLRENRRPNRLEVMTLPEAEKLARTLNISNKTRQGQEDFAHVRELLIELQSEGSTVAFKEPGCSVHHSKTILAASAKAFLRDEDLFIFAMTKLQAQLLTKYGKMVSTDGTHAVFAYGNIKLIVVMVTSFSSRSEVKERGFPVGFALTTSEREDVHKAIVAHLLTAVPTWKPELLMTDMAFGAYNAWYTFFPDLEWLWCVFHVWQAWIKRLRRAQRPEGVGKDEWSILKGHLIRALKELIAPKVNPTMSFDEFRQTCSLVVNLMWFHGLDEMANCFETYMKNESRWAPPARRATVQRVFGSCERMPKLAKSNNPLEAFFGVLKYDLLDGKCVRTVESFLDIWRIYQARLFSNVAKSHVLNDLELQQIPRPANSDAIDPFEVEDEREQRAEDDAVEGDDFEEIDDETNGEDNQQEASGHPESDDLDDFEAANRRQLLRTLASEKELMKRALETLSSVVEAAVINVGTEGIYRLRMLRRSLETTLVVGRAAIELDGSTVEMLSRVAAPVAFVRQSANFGASAPASLMLSVSQAVAQTSMTAPGGDSQGASQDAADYSRLHKSKKRKKSASERSLASTERPFCEFAAEKLADETAATRIAVAKKRACESGMPLLKIALNANIKTRIRALSLDVYKVRFPASISKSDLISRLLVSIQSCLPQLPEDVAQNVADIGIVHTASPSVAVGEVVYLRENATNNDGERCVVACESLAGWIARDSYFVFIDTLNLRDISWGRLSEKSQEPSIID
jgi:hypothetical protein